MHKKLIIIGASGHGKVVADIAEKLHRYEEIAFLDDNAALKECMGYPVVGKSDGISERKECFYSDINTPSSSRWSSCDNW